MMLAFASLLFIVALCFDSRCFVLSLQTNPDDFASINRRTFAQRIVVGPTVALPFVFPKQATAESLADLQATTKEARSQLDAVPAIIQKEEWDKIRAILITSPISDFWGSSTKRGSNVIKDIADAVGDAGGDELNILELREDLQSHLRYLDMAAYNNVFNPITREGTAGATRELVRSYYEDPKNELKASIAALDGILQEIASTNSP